MALNNNAINAMLDHLGTLITFASLHTASPGGTGANEQSLTGSPAYARKSITWNTAAAGNLDSSNAPVFDLPATTITHVGFWSAVTAGINYGDADITDEVFAAQGTYTLTDADISGT